MISCPHIEKACTSAYYSIVGSVTELIRRRQPDPYFTGNNVGAKVPPRAPRYRLTRPPTPSTGFTPTHWWTTAHRAEILGALATIMLGTHN